MAKLSETAEKAKAKTGKVYAKAVAAVKEPPTKKKEAAKSSPAPEKKVKAAATKALPEGATPDIIIARHKASDEEKEEGEGKQFAYVATATRLVRDSRGKEYKKGAVIPLDNTTRRSKVVIELGSKFPGLIMRQDWNDAVGYASGKRIVSRVKAQVE